MNDLTGPRVQNRLDRSDFFYGRLRWRQLWISLWIKLREEHALSIRWPQSVGECDNRRRSESHPLSLSHSLGPVSCKVSGALTYREHITEKITTEPNGNQIQG